MFVRSLGHKDRHKIQDIWDSEPYRVLKRPDAHGPVYTVVSLEDPTKIRTVHRKHLLDAKELVPEVHDLSTHSEGETGLETELESQGSISSDDEGDYLVRRQEDRAAERGNSQKPIPSPCVCYSTRDSDGAGER